VRTPSQRDPPAWWLGEELTPYRKKKKKTNLLRNFTQKLKIGAFLRTR